MNRRFATSAITHGDALPAIPQGVHHSRPRHWLARWLVFLANTWLPSRPTTLKGPR